MGRPKTNIAEAREKLLSSAEVLMGEIGAKRLTVTAIAERSGMSQSNAYRFFRKKDELMQALANRWFDPVLACFSGLSEKNPPPDARLVRAIVDCLAIYIERYEKSARRFGGYMDLSRTYPDAIAPHVAFMRMQLTEWIVDALIAAGQPESLHEPAAQLFLDMTVLFRNPNLLPLYPDDATPIRAERTVRVFLNLAASPDRLAAALERDDDAP